MNIAYILSVIVLAKGLLDFLYYSKGSKLALKSAIFELVLAIFFFVIGFVFLKS